MAKLYRLHPLAKYERTYLPVGLKQQKKGALAPPQNL